MFSSSIDKINGFEYYWVASITLWCCDTQKYSGMKVPFYNIVGVILILWWVFQIFKISFKYFQCFPVPENKWWLLDWLWGVFFLGGVFSGRWNTIEWKSLFPILQLTKLLLFDWYWGVLLKTVHFRTFEYSKRKDPFLIIVGAYSNTLVFFSCCINFCQRFLEFSSFRYHNLAARLILRFATRGKSVLEPWNIVEWKSNISIFSGLFWYLGNFSKFY